MGEEVSGYVNARSGSSSVVIVIKGRISPDCLETLKTLIKKWAEHCGLAVGGVKVNLKKIKKAKKKKK